VADAITKSFGDFAGFKDKFSKAAAGQFGSGWAWLVKSGDGLAIETTSNAETPFAVGKTCLLTIDVWEHAYYIDYRNARPKYIEEFWKLVNWDFANKNLK
jgi:superoxide dismutase, Fe-Mn family